MSKILVIALCFLVTVNALRSFDPTEDRRCAKAAKNNERVVFEHESDCSKYYMCKGSLKYEMDCPYIDDILGTKMFFNPEVNDCDFPYRTECGKINED